MKEIISLFIQLAWFLAGFACAMLLYRDGCKKSKLSIYEKAAIFCFYSVVYALAWIIGLKL